jgi:hypothetical protein
MILRINSDHFPINHKTMFLVMGKQSVFCEAKRVKLSLFLIKHHNMRTYEGVKVWFHAFLSLEVSGLIHAPATLLSGKSIEYEAG